jgi:hypothetical protein
MATFPIKDADVLALAQEMATGFAHNPTDFPSPPVGYSILGTYYNQTMIAINNLQAARAAYEAAATAKKAQLDTLKQAMRDDLRYSEVITHMNDEKLKKIGWAAHRNAKAVALPGQVLDLSIVEEGPAWVKLAWKLPKTGGRITLYEIEQLDPATSEWKHVISVMSKTVTLQNQPTGVQLLYRVSAVNKSGAGTPSNSIRLVL